LLEAYVFGDEYGPFRVPRGIDPAVVLRFLADRLPSDAPPPAFARALEVLRFYELPEALPELTRPLADPVGSAEDLARDASVLQAMGDLGGSEDGARAATFLDGRLVPHPAAEAAFPLLLETRLALAPHGSDEALALRIHGAVERARADEEKDEAGMMRFDAAAAIERNDLARERALAQAKTSLLRAPGPERIGGLVQTYLGRAPGGGPYLETWAGRMLRRQAFASAPAPVLEALERSLDAAPPPRQGVLGAFLAVRAAQAILYLGGELSPEREAHYQEALPIGGAMNFLWDDP
jgi:hypothetical protein